MAFLQGSLEEGLVVYDLPPTGFSTGAVEDGVFTSSHSLKRAKCTGSSVEKPVYGMEQASRSWQRSLSPRLLERGESHTNVPRRLTQSTQGACVFFTHHTTTTPSGLICSFSLFAMMNARSTTSSFLNDLAKAWEVQRRGRAFGTSECGDILKG